MNKKIIGLKKWFIATFYGDDGIDTECYDTIINKLNEMILEEKKEDE